MNATLDDWYYGSEEENNLPPREYSKPFGRANPPKIGISGHPDETKYTRQMAKEDKNRLEAFLAKRGLASKGYNQWFWESRAGFVRGRRSNKPIQDLGRDDQRDGSGRGDRSPKGGTKKAKGSRHLHLRPNDRTSKPKHGGIQ